MPHPAKHAGEGGLGGTWSPAPAQAGLNSTAAPGPYRPRENSFRPTFSCTSHVGPAAFSRRVSAGSPGGTSTQSAGGVRTSPLGARTVPGRGPGVQIIGSGMAGMVRPKPEV